MVWLWFATLVLACGGRDHASVASPRGAPPVAQLRVRQAKTRFFGTVAIDDGAVSLMDGGTHGVQGHTATIAADGRVQWERRVEGLHPQGKPGAGVATLGADELAVRRREADVLWALAVGKTGYFGGPEDGPPRFVWAIVMRRGDEIRVLEGGGMPGGDRVPGPARGPLDWLRTRVDAWAR